MSYIFDSFPSKQKAEQYVNAVRKLGIKADIWDSAKEMNDAGRRAISKNKNDNTIDPVTKKVCDVFPFRLIPPIVTVHRFTNEKAESKAETMVGKYGGVFVGT